MATTLLGGETGTDSSKFKVGIIYDPVYNTTNWSVKIKIGIKVTKGNFQGSFIQYHDDQYSINGGTWTHCGWNPTGTTLDASGLYCVMPEKTYTAEYGQNIRVRAYVGYTGNSGTTYKSYLTIDLSCPNIVYIYNDSGWKRATPYIYTNGAWKRSSPYIYYDGWKKSHKAERNYSISTDAW